MFAHDRLDELAKGENATVSSGCGPSPHARHVLRPIPRVKFVVLPREGGESGGAGRKGGVTYRVNLSEQLEGIFTARL